MLEEMSVASMEGGNVTKWNGLDSGHETGVGMVGSRVCMVPCM